VYVDVTFGRERGWAMGGVDFGLIHASFENVARAPWVLVKLFESTRGGWGGPRFGWLSTVRNSMRWDSRGKMGS
jgi:hypothetical protein